jgi:hypothetical protein
MPRVDEAAQPSVAIFTRDEARRIAVANPEKHASSAFYNGCDAMTIADYFAIGVLIVLTLWGATRLFRPGKS